MSHKLPANPAVENGAGEAHLVRALSNRHIQLIAIGGAIGTGLFMGSGRTISVAGPSIIFVYALIGFMLFFVMRAMGELLLSNLNYKSFADFATDLLGPWGGFFTGWTYWFCWVVTGVADVIAIAGYSQELLPALNTSLLWIPALLCIAVLLVLNLPTVKAFGELEFWFALIKIIAIVALIVTGLVMILANFQTPAGTAAAETRNPEHNLPKAINAIPLRVGLFYAGSLIILMAVTPWNQFVAGRSSTPSAWPD